MSAPDELDGGGEEEEQDILQGEPYSVFQKKKSENETVHHIQLSIYLSIYPLPIYLSYTYPTIHLSINLSICLQGVH